MELMQTLDVIVGKIGAFAWGPPMLILLVGTGIWLTLALRGLQFTKLGHALYLALIKRKEETDEPGDITHFPFCLSARSTGRQKTPEKKGHKSRFSTIRRRT